AKFVQQSMFKDYPETIAAEVIEKKKSKMRVYEPEDLATISEQIISFSHLLGSFSGYLAISDRPTVRDQRYLQLFQEPRIRLEIDQLRANRKKNPPKKKSRSKPIPSK